MNNLSKMYSPLATMKKLAVCAVMVCVCMGAQAENKTFDKLAKIKDVDLVRVDKSMIEMAAKAGTGIHLGDAINLDDESGDMLKSINGIKVFHCDKKEAMEELKNKATKLLKGKEWQTLMDMKSDEGQIVKIYQAKDGEDITNVVLALEEDEAVLVVIEGTFDLTKMMEKGNNAETDNSNED